jgi:hypothetical protein
MAEIEAANKLENGVLCRNLTRPTILAGFIFIAEKGPQPSSLWKCGNPRCVRVSKRRGLRLGAPVGCRDGSPARHFHSEAEDSAHFHQKAAVDHCP